MSSFNRVIVLGNLVSDPELRFTAGKKKAVVDCSLAVNERWKKGDELVEETSYLDFVCFGRTAEVCNQYLIKGSPVHIEGRLKQERWEKDGQKRSRVKIVVEKLTLIGGSKTREEEAVPATAGAGSEDAAY